MKLKIIALMVLAQYQPWSYAVPFSAGMQAPFVTGVAPDARPDWTRNRTTTPFIAMSTQNVRVDLYRDETYLNDDQSYTQTITQVMTLLTSNAVSNNQSMMSPSYYAGYQTVKLLEAYVEQPDGTKIQVPLANVFITTAPADPHAPGFDTALVQSVAFPQLKKGSKIYARWEYNQLKPLTYNYANVSSPVFGNDSLHTEMSVNLPETMYVQWAKRGAYQEREEHINGRHIISAMIGPQMAQTAEPFMTASSDSAPFFEVSTVKSWQEIADSTWKAVQPSQVVTPDIQKLVSGLIGKKTGREAAQILYDWVANNIAYMAIVLDPRMGYVPMPASQIIFDRYTDCKGHSSLLQTLLKAAGIESYPVLVNWDNSLTQYPLPVNSFDHEMLYIPSLQTIANPTNSYNPFGSPLEETNYYSGSLQVLADKPILLAQPNNPGKALIKTPVATPAQSQYHLTSSMTIDLQGHIQATGTIDGTGTIDSTLRGYLSQDTLTKSVNTTLYNNGITGQATATGTAATDLSKQMSLQYTWRANSVSQAANEEYLLQIPNGPDYFPTKFFKQFLNQTGKRNYPIVVGAGIFDWSYNITLPVGYLIKNLPKAINFSNNTGSYVATYTLAKDKLSVHRTLTILNNVYAPTEYMSLYTLLIDTIKDGDTILQISPIPVAFPGLVPTSGVTVPASGVKTR